MNATIRSELLRSVSGFSVLAVYLVALLLPVFVLVSDGARLDLTGVESAVATTRLLQPLAWTAISAAFVSAYGVTREFYYGSMDRTLVSTGFARAFGGKLVAGVFAGMAFSICVFAVWTVGVAIFVAREGLTLTLTDDSWHLFAGALAGSALGALIGGAIGWITRNYYLTAGIVLVLPMAVELALLRTAPDLARFSPGLTLAALGAPGYEGTLLEFAPALGIALVWTGSLVLIAWFRGRRRGA